MDDNDATLMAEREKVWKLFHVALDAGLTQLAKTIVKDMKTWNSIPGGLMDISKRDFGQASVDELVERIRMRLQRWETAFENDEVSFLGDQEPDGAAIAHGIVMSTFLLQMEDIMRMSRMMSTSEYDALHMAAEFAKVPTEAITPAINEVFLVLEIAYTVGVMTLEDVQRFAAVYQEHIDRR